MFFLKNIIKFLAYLVRPADKSTGPKPDRWLALSLIAIPFIILIGTQGYFYVRTHNYKSYALKTMRQDMEALQFSQLRFSEPMSYCKHYYRSVRMYCGASIANQGKGLNYDYARRQAQANGWQLVTATQGTGTPETGWLRYAGYTKEKKCLTLREVEGPDTTQVTLALDHECPAKR